MPVTEKRELMTLSENETPDCPDHFMKFEEIFFSNDRIIGIQLVYTIAFKHDIVNIVRYILTTTRSCYIRILLQY